MLRETLQQILDNYQHARTATPFGKANPIAQAFEAAREAYAGSAAVQQHPTIRVKASYGKGNWTAVPWIAFLDERETDTTQHGVYPVLLFADDMSGVSLNLSQGVTDVIQEHGNRDGKVILAERAAELRDYCTPLAGNGFVLDTPDKKLGKEYEMATAAYKFYPRDGLPTDNTLFEDLAAMLEAYADYLGDRDDDTGELGYIDGDICLIGAGKANPEQQARALEQLAQHGAWASWWSYPISRLIQQRLRTPFYFYVSRKGEGITLRYKVAEYETSRGNNGIQSPWPEITIPEWRNSHQITTKRSGIAKTWLKIVEIVEMTPPLSEKDFEPIKLPNRSSDKLVLRHGFGYAVLKQSHSVREPSVTAEPFNVDDALTGLFMDPAAFRHVVDTLQQKKNVILQGAPGVGKTFVAKRLAYAVIGEKAPDRVEMIQFHQSYAYEDFIQGYRPTGQGFDLRNGVFHDFCRRAAQDSTRRYVFIIDEINRGNLSKILGELMLLIEPDKRGPEWGLYLTYQDRSKPKFYVPDNLYLLGLMNTADRSIAMVDYALRRRFGFIDVEPGFTTQAFREHLSSAGAASALIERIVGRMQQLNAKIAADTANLGPGFRIGHSFFSAPSNTPLDESWYQRVIQTEIAPLIREYWFDDTEQAETLIKQLLSA